MSLPWWVGVLQRVLAFHWAESAEVADTCVCGSCWVGIGKRDAASFCPALWQAQSVKDGRVGGKGEEMNTCLY
jgi:hypothetical protein